MNIVKSVAWFYVKDNKVLCTRTKGKDMFYIPGGKVDAGESLEEALIRELHEELCIKVEPSSIKPCITIKAPAHGYPEGTKVHMHCFFASFTGNINKACEIEELLWVSYKDRTLCAPAAKEAIEYLAKLKEITP